MAPVRHHVHRRAPGAERARQRAHDGRRTLHLAWLAASGQTLALTVATEVHRHARVLRHPIQIVERELLVGDAVALIVARVLVLQVAWGEHTLEPAPRRVAMDALAHPADFAGKLVRIAELANVVRREPVVRPARRRPLIVERRAGQKRGYRGGHHGHPRTPG